MILCFRQLRPIYEKWLGDRMVFFTRSKLFAILVMRSKVEFFHEIEKFILAIQVQIIESLYKTLNFWLCDQVAIWYLGQMIETYSSFSKTFIIWHGCHLTPWSDDQISFYFKITFKRLKHFLAMTMTFLLQCFS
jgi:hypothetical protein